MSTYLGGEGRGGNWLATDKTEVASHDVRIKTKMQNFAVRLAKEVTDFNTLYEGLNCNKMATVVYFKKYLQAWSSSKIYVRGSTMLEYTGGEI